jgi:D-hydroxyproline dehydrogenase subunit gamma
MDIDFTLDGAAARCPEGLTIVGALFHIGRRTLRWTPRGASPRSVFCGMGVCLDCVLEVDGRPGVRACTTLLKPGMRVARPKGVTALS